jgi:hypothetical protein
MKKIGFILLAAFVLSSANAQEELWRGKSVDFSHGKLIVSKNKRYLEHADGTPFFYLGDTAWELFHRLNEAEVDEYLENRRAKGFTVIQAVILAELDGLQTPDANGRLPLKNLETVEPNEAYFEWVDKVIRKAEEKGMYIGLLPTWGDKVDKQWGVGPEVFTPETAARYGAWLGGRYKDFPNIIWVNGGDRAGGGDNFPVWDALGKALRAADPNHLITFHPQGERSSSEWFQECEWLDFNMIQTGHCQRSYAIYDRLLVKDYNNQKRTKPTFDAEPRYENHPICWQPDSLGWFDDVDVRQAMYWNLFSGAMGHTYGCHDIWQMLAPGREPTGQARGYWRTSLDLPGAFDLIYARRLMERFDWGSRAPALEMIVSKNNSDTDKKVALKGEGYAFVYFPLGGETEIDCRRGGLTGEVTLSWMDPRTGSVRVEGKRNASSVIVATSPSSGRGHDWVLIIQE